MRYTVSQNCFAMGGFDESTGYRLRAIWEMDRLHRSRTLPAVQLGDRVTYDDRQATAR